MVSMRLLASVVLILRSQVLACEFDRDCSNGEKCCDYDCITSSDCYGHFCTSDEQCGEDSTMACCESRCVYGSDCAGRSCTSSTDCSLGEYCCNGICQEGDCNDDHATDRLVVILIIVSSVVGAGIVCCVCLIVCTCRRRTRNRGQVVANARIAQATTTYGSTSYGNQAVPPQAQHYYGAVYPHPQAGQPNMGYQSQYPVTSSAPAQQSGAPPAYADVVGSQRVQQHVGAAEVPHPQPSAPSF